MRVDDDLRIVPVQHGGKETHRYGTIARLTVKPCMLDQLRQQNRLVTEELSAADIEFEHIFQADGNENDRSIVVCFTSREAYQKNAESREQHERY